MVCGILTQPDRRKTGGGGWGVYQVLIFSFLKEKEQGKQPNITREYQTSLTVQKGAGLCTCTTKSATGGVTAQDPI